MKDLQGFIEQKMISHRRKAKLSECERVSENLPEPDGIVPEPKRITSIPEVTFTNAHRGTLWFRATKTYLALRPKRGQSFFSWAARVIKDVLSCVWLISDPDQPDPVPPVHPDPDPDQWSRMDKSSDSVSPSQKKVKVQVEKQEAVTAELSLVTIIMPAHSPVRISSWDPDPGVSSCLSRSHSVTSPCALTSAHSEVLQQAESLPDMLLRDFLKFTPDVSVHVDDEDSYRFRCSTAGRYQCSETGLVFNMEGEGEVVYSIIPWNQSLLAHHHKKPAGPLFDIQCDQECLCQLYLPHCEILSTGGCEFLSVAHVKGEDIELITPDKITGTHVIMDIKGLSPYGNVKDEDAPAVPIEALVLLFYSPPADPDPESVLTVLLLPSNVVLPHLRKARRRSRPEERYLETISNCTLIPKQKYNLSTSPQHDSVLVQPLEAEFKGVLDNNYIPTFQILLDQILQNIELFLFVKDTNSSPVWNSLVRLSEVRRTRGANLPTNEKLAEIRSDFIKGISGPVLDSLLDKLLKENVLTDSESRPAYDIPNSENKARYVIDTVKNKGDAAASVMIDFLCEVDPFLSQHIGLV